jgi:hypothetical protein
MLKFDDELWGFIDFASQRSIIGQILADGNTSSINAEGNFFKYEGAADMVTYLPASKFEKVERPWEQGRTSIKIGRFVRKFLNEHAIKYYDVTDSRIEEFVNMFKSYFTQDESMLEIVEGKDIMKYYREDSYHTDGFRRSGSLWNSCMRQHERNRFMKLYADNPDSVKMLVYLDGEGQVRARALLWEDVRAHHDAEARYKVMDRIYSFYDHDVSFFKNWAAKNGYLSKLDQNAKSERIFSLPEGSDEQVGFMELYVILECSEQEFYPYLDTFKFYNAKKNRFSNSDSFRFDYTLVQSCGERERHEEEDVEDESYDEDDEANW